MSLLPISYRTYRVWQRNRDVFLRLWPTEVGPIFLEPLFHLGAMGLGLGTYVVLGGEQSYLQFIVPGIMASYTMFTASFECTFGSYVKMEMQKTFDGIIATPVNIEDVIAGEILWAATRSLISASAITLVALGFGLVNSPLVVLVPLIAVLAGLMFGSMAMLYTSLVPSINTFNYYFTLFVTPMFLFGGVFFPLSGLPDLVQRVAWFIPLTHMVNLFRSVVSGEMHRESLFDLLWILVATAVFFSLAIVMMRRRLIK